MTTISLNNSQFLSNMASCEPSKPISIQFSDVTDDCVKANRGFNPNPMQVHNDF